MGLGPEPSPAESLAGLLAVDIATGCEVVPTASSTSVLPSLVGAPECHIGQ
jgi:hypothetical protein